MRICIIESALSAKSQQTFKEAALLADSGLEVILVGPGKEELVRGSLPSGCCWIPVGRPAGRLKRKALPLLIWRKAIGTGSDFYHAHCSVSMMLVAYLAAAVTRGRYVADYNDAVILAKHSEDPGQITSEHKFEQTEHWARPLSETEAARIEATLAIIPASVRSVLDVGCGDGRITNRVAERISQTIGLDSARAAIGHIKPPAQVLFGSADDLPVPSRSIDLVLSTEVIEHLPKPVYRAALAEMQRVALRYILIGVPLEEQLVAKRIVCPIDGHLFNVTGHMRNFQKGELGKLFSEFRLSELRECGADQRFYYHRVLLLIRQRLGGIWARMPYAVCPKCSTKLYVGEGRERNAVLRWCDKVNTKIRRRKSLRPSHVLALYERKAT